MELPSNSRYNPRDSGGKFGGGKKTEHVKASDYDASECERLAKNAKKTETFPPPFAENFCALDLEGEREAARD